MVHTFRESVFPSTRNRNSCVTNNKRQTKREGFKLWLLTTEDPSLHDGGINVRFLVKENVAEMVGNSPALESSTGLKEIHEMTLLTNHHNIMLCEEVKSGK